MTACQHCTRKTALYLCTPCTQNLAALLTELPWLLHQLDVTICRQDHLHTGTGGHNLNPNPVNVGAMELMRTASSTLHQIALDVCEIHASKKIPALVNASPPQVAHWLKTNLRAIQNHPNAGKHYTAISELVGDQQPGPIHHAINRADTHFAGPCPVTRAHNQHGEDIPCGHMLYAHEGETFVTCPRCQTTIDVEHNRRQSAAKADLLPVELIIEVMNNLGENIKPSTIYTWIHTGRLKTAGFLTRKGWNKRRTRPSDPRVYSLARARQLAARQPATTPTYAVYR